MTYFRTEGVLFCIIQTRLYFIFLTQPLHADNVEAPNHSRSAFGAESAFPLNFQLAIVHASLVVGEAKMREKVTASVANTVGLEATELYPDMKYVTIEELMCMDGL